VPIDVTLPFPAILTKVNRDRLVKGEMGLFVFGTISYIDAFKKRRETRVRMALIGEGQEPGNHVFLSPMEQGNTATQKTQRLPSDPEELSRSHFAGQGTLPANCTTTAAPARLTSRRTRL
jgi:hypothetical protein